MQVNRKDFYKTVAGLVLPIALQNLINVGVTSADVIMLGKVGETALSGASLGGQIYFIMTLFFFGLTSGSAVLTAQYWGKGDIPAIEKILGIAVSVGIAVSIIFTLAAQIFPGQLMYIFTSDPEIIEQGVQYLKIISLSYVISGITLVYLSIMRSVERVVVAAVIYTLSLFVNIILNAVFIFGLLGAPAMGVRGAALGTVIARIVEFVCVIFYASKLNHTIKVRWKFLISWDRVLCRDFRHYATPVVLNELGWGIGMAMFSVIMGHLGSASVAAYSVTQVSRQLALVVSFGVSSAAAILCGKAIGEGKEVLAKEYASRLLKLSFVLGVLGGLVILGLTPVLKTVMNLTPQAQSYLTVMLCIMAGYVLFQSVNCTMIVGIFRSGGDTRYGLFLDTGTLWLGSVGLGALSAFVIGVPMPWVFLVLCCDEILKLPLAWRRYRSYRWLRNVTR